MAVYENAPNLISRKVESDQLKGLIFSKSKIEPKHLSKLKNHYLKSCTNQNLYISDWQNSLKL